MPRSSASSLAQRLRCNAHERSTPAGRKLLNGMLVDAAKRQEGLGPCAYEMKIAADLMCRGSRWCCPGSWNGLWSVVQRRLNDGTQALVKEFDVRSVTRRWAGSGGLDKTQMAVSLRRHFGLESNNVPMHVQPGRSATVVLVENAKLVPHTMGQSLTSCTRPAGTEIETRRVRERPSCARRTPNWANCRPPRRGHDAGPR